MDDLTKLSKEELVREHGARVGAFIKIDASSPQAIELSNKYGESRDELLRRLTPPTVGDHPEDNCDKCSHRMRLNYAADSDTWNKVVGDAWSIICVDCFIELCQKAGVEPKFVVFHIRGSEFYHEVIPQPVGEIGELLETVAMMPGCCSSTTDRVGFSRTIDALRTAVAKMQAGGKTLVDEVDKRFAENKRLDTEITTLRGLLAWAISKVCDYCGCDNVNRTLCPVTRPDCPAVYARAELEVGS